MEVERLFLALTTQRLMVLILLPCIFVMASQEIMGPDFRWHLLTLISAWSACVGYLALKELGGTLFH